MKSIDLVSVIIPCYNHEQFIVETLCSIEKSTYRNIEICIIDDGSTDNSEYVIRKWMKKSSISIKFKTRENLGITKTLNELILMSEGRYIALIGSDDLLTHRSLEERIHYLKSNKQVKAVYGDAYVIDEHDNLIYKSALFEYLGANKINLFSHHGIKKEFILNWAMPGPVLMFDKDVINIIGAYNEKLLVEDWDFYLRLSSKNLIGFLDSTVASYRIHHSNMSLNKKYKLKIKLDMLKIIFFNINKFSFNYKLLFIRLLISKIF